MVEKHKHRKEDAADTVLLCMTCQHPREQHVFKLLGSEAQTQTQTQEREDLKASDDTEGYIICLGFGQFTANPCTCSEFSATSPPTWTY
jgi:hypothetical protein